MKKILLVLLLLFLMPISISAEEKYEFKGGILYNDGKKVTGTFELISRKNKAKGSFVMVYLMEYLRDIILMEVLC